MYPTTAYDIYDSLWSRTHASLCHRERQASSPFAWCRRGADLCRPAHVCRCVHGLHRLSPVLWVCCRWPSVASDPGIRHARRDGLMVPVKKHRGTTADPRSKTESESCSLWNANSASRARVSPSGAGCCCVNGGAGSVAQTEAVEGMYEYVLVQKECWHRIRMGRDGPGWARAARPKTAGAQSVASSRSLELIATVRSDPLQINQKAITPPSLAQSGLPLAARFICLSEVMYAHSVIPSTSDRRTPASQSCWNLHFFARAQHYEVQHRP